MLRGARELECFGRADDRLLSSILSIVRYDLVWRIAGRPKLVKPPLARRRQKGRICVS